MFININNSALINSDIIDKIEKTSGERTVAQDGTTIVETPPVISIRLKPHNELKEFKVYNVYFDTNEERDAFYDYVKTHINII